MAKSKPLVQTSGPVYHNGKLVEPSNIDAIQAVMQQIQAANFTPTITQVLPDNAPVPWLNLSPTFTRGNLILSNEDNLVLMKRYPDKYFDLAIVDPPYGINMSQYKNRTTADRRGKRHKVSDWDSKPPGDEYFTELFRVSKQQIIWGGNYFRQLTGLDPFGMKSIQEFQEYITSSPYTWILWYKKQLVKNFSEGELAWHNIPGIGNMQFDFQVAGFLTDEVIYEKKIHQTQKPVDLYNWLFDQFATPGMKILDTHLGSGSIAVSAWYKGIDLTGCEIDTVAFDKMVKRINERTKQITLF